MKRFCPQRAGSIGIIEHYRCTNSCAHCLYACHPGIEENVDEKALDLLVESIRRACPQALIHIGGGEPFLNPEHTIHLVSRLNECGLRLEYVETNGFWIRTADPHRMIERVREAGCSCILLSISPFHNEFLSLDDNIRAYAMIEDVFGKSGIFPWHPAYYPFLRYVAADRPIDFEDYVTHFRKDEIRLQLTSIIYLHPAGRASVTFSPFLDSFPAETYLHKNCWPELSSPDHAHVDHYGNYLTGFCAGLCVGRGAAFEMNKLYTEGINLEDYPILEMLLRGTLGDLYNHALSLGFSPDPVGYISSCHLCGHIRTWIFHRIEPGGKPPELAPAFFYEEMCRLFSLTKEKGRTVVRP